MTTNLFQVIETPLKKMGIGQNRKGNGPIFFVGLSDSNRIEIGTDDPCRRGGLFDLGNNPDPPSPPCGRGWSAEGWPGEGTGTNFI